MTKQLLAVVRKTRLTARSHGAHIVPAVPHRARAYWHDAFRAADDPARRLAAGIMAPIGNHSVRASGITAYLSNGGAREHAQEMAAHESPRTTKLYDRTKERLTQEVERIRL